MIQTVIKRDGRIVGFNEEKIATAMLFLSNFVFGSVSYD